MTKYYPPTAARTGSTLGQPWSEQTQSGWYLDVHAQYTETGFLDAPLDIPVGSACAVDVGSLTLGVAHNRREPQF